MIAAYMTVRALKQPIRPAVSGEPELSVDIGVVGDQAGRAVNLPA